MRNIICYVVLASLVNFRIALLQSREGAFDRALSRLLPLAAMGTYPEVIESLGICVLRTPLLPSEVPEQDRGIVNDAQSCSRQHPVAKGPIFNGFNTI